MIYAKPTRRTCMDCGAECQEETWIKGRCRSCYNTTHKAARRKLESLKRYKNKSVRRGEFLSAVARAFGLDPKHKDADVVLVIDLTPAGLPR